jgi:hypothetical protein
MTKTGTTIIIMVVMVDGVMMEVSFRWTFSVAIYEAAKPPIHRKQSKSKQTNDRPHRQTRLCAMQ